MSADYIPKSQLDLAAWARNFSAKISATPGAFGLMDSDAAAIAQAVGLFDDVLTRAINPDTSTKPAVADKDAKRAAMLVTLRMYAQTIKRNLGVSNDAKVSLGLHIDAAGPSPVPAPSTVPVLVVDGDAPLVQRVAFRDVATPDRKAKPPGTIGIMLSVAVASAGETPPTYEAAPVYGIATRQPYRVQFPADARGKVAFYFGRWITRAGRVGPWSSMAQLSIAG